LSKNASDYIDDQDNFKNTQPIHFKRIMLEKDSFDFSFSGMKAQAYTFIEHYKKDL
jgi:tRNA A37 threonylcarbamoyltransferase TsaD